MCGIAALFRTGESGGVSRQTLEAMTRAAAHRGPDGEGTEYFPLAPGEAWRVGLGHRRLAILDLSAEGLQPMTRGRLVVTYNGEVYNYREIAAELRTLGHVFRTRTDTEVILAAYQEWGPACFSRFRGMWGLVLVDLDARRAVLSRDRLGIKPLYVWQGQGRGQSRVVAVVSEQKQLTALPGSVLRADVVQVRTYLATGYEHPSRTFFEGVRPVAPGTVEVLDLESLRLSPPEPYWHPERVRSDVRDPVEAAARLRSVLRDSVRLHLRSDVPVGAALSGGLDSSAITSLVAELGREGGEDVPPPSTFSVTFPGEPEDERSFTDQAARHVGARTHFVTPTPEDFLADLDRFVWTHDEPVGSLSQYSAYALARLTRGAGVPVILNGQGGDEVLSGYWQCYFVFLRRLLLGGRLLDLGRHLAGALFPGGNPEILRQVPRMLKRYRSRDRRAPGAAEGPVEHARAMGPEAWRIFEIRDLTLPRLLKWDDRNFMAFSVEGRYPFLDHTVIETCLGFDTDVLYRRGWTKEPLRDALVGLLPQSILRRRTKLGFEAPQERWLAGPLAPVLAEFVSGDAPVWEFTEPGEARRLAARARAGANREESQALLRLFLLDRWMRCFGLGGSPSAASARVALEPCASAS